MSAEMDTDQLIEWLKSRKVRQSILDKLRGDLFHGYIRI